MHRLFSGLTSQLFTFKYKTQIAIVMDVAKRLPVPVPYGMLWCNHSPCLKFILSVLLDVNDSLLVSHFSSVSKWEVIIIFICEPACRNRIFPWLNLQRRSWRETKCKSCLVSFVRLDLPSLIDIPEVDL